MADDDVITFRSPFCVGGIHRAPSDTALPYLTALQRAGFQLDRVPADASPQLLALLERAGFVRLDVPDVDAEPDTFSVKRGPGRPRKAE